MSSSEAEFADHTYIDSVAELPRHIQGGKQSLNRLERVGETLRHALNILAEVAPDWLRAHTAPDQLGQLVA